MGQLDNALRTQAIPFLGQIAGYNRSDQSDQDISQCTAAGDLRFLFNQGGTAVPQQHNLIRVLNPQLVSVTAAYLTLSLTTATDETQPSFYLTVGTGYTGGASLVPSIPFDSEIVARHALLKGDSNPFTTASGTAGTITINKLNILGMIPKATDPNYRQDCFVIGLHFPKQPSANTGWKLSKLELQMAGVMTNGI